MTSTSERLTLARKESGYSIAEAGNLSGVPSSEIHRFEAGEVEPDQLDLRRLGVIYGCSLEYLLGQPV